MRYALKIYSLKTKYLQAEVGGKKFDWVKVDRGRAIDPSFGVFNKFTLKAVVPKIPPALVTLVVKSRKANLNFPKFGLKIPVSTVQSCPSVPVLKEVK